MHISKKRLIDINKTMSCLEMYNFNYYSYVILFLCFYNYVEHKIFSFVIVEAIKHC